MTSRDETASDALQIAPDALMRVRIHRESGMLTLSLLSALGGLSDRRVLELLMPSDRVVANTRAT
jgi:hypothetical protein